MNKRQAKKKRKTMPRKCKKCKYLMHSNRFGFDFCGLFLTGYSCIKDIKKQN